MLFVRKVHFSVSFSTRHKVLRLGCRPTRPTSPKCHFLMSLEWDSNINMLDLLASYSTICFSTRVILFLLISDETCCCHFYVEVHGQNRHFHISLLQIAVKGSPLLCRRCRQVYPFLFLCRSHKCNFLVPNGALGLWYAEWKGFIFL